MANGSICCGFWYFTNDDELTDITNGNVWSANEWEVWGHEHDVPIAAVRDMPTKE